VEAYLRLFFGPLLVAAFLKSRVRYPVLCPYQVLTFLFSIFRFLLLLFPFSDQQSTLFLRLPKLSSGELCASRSCSLAHLPENIGYPASTLLSFDFPLFFCHLSESVCVCHFPLFPSLELDPSSGRFDNPFSFSHTSYSCVTSTVRLESLWDAPSPSPRFPPTPPRLPKYHVPPKRHVSHSPVPPFPVHLPPTFPPLITIHFGFFFQVPLQV